MKDKIFGALIKLALCPGSPDESETCLKCPRRGDPEGDCGLKLKEHCRKLLVEVDRAEESHNPDLTLLVTNILQQIGVPAHIKGYGYLRKAITLVIESPVSMEGVTKVLYPEVAKEFNTSPSRVERSIRHAIGAAWDRGDLEVLNHYFGNTISPNRGKPTNSEFIAAVTDRIRLELKTPV